jgi:hypothetical protein
MKKLNKLYLNNVYVYGSRSTAGEIISVGDGIARVSYLRDIKTGEMI